MNCPEKAVLFYIRVVTVTAMWRSHDQMLTFCCIWWGLILEAESRTVVGFVRFPWCTSHRYYIIDEFKNWTEAQDYCRKNYNDLATFDNEEEHDQVVQTLTSGGYTGSVWIGLYDDRYSWRWSNSKKNMTYTNWAGNEPSNYQSKEACAWLYFTGFWYDDQCGNPLSVLYSNTENKPTVTTEP
uniref:C-type lectin domain-containing protein n=1 Tax=Cyprinus carpio TaxID=7962 RepID=A0A8C1WYE9_CYPCA